MITLNLMVNKMLCLIKYSSFLIILKLGGGGVMVRVSLIFRSINPSLFAIHFSRTNVPV